MKRTAVADLAVALGAAATAATALVLSGSLPVLAADPAGLALWPRILSTVILLGVALVILERLWQRRAAVPEPAPPAAPAAEPGSDRPVRVADPQARVWLCGALFVFYAGLVAMVGFLLPTFLLVAALMLLFGSRLVETLLYAVALAIGLHLFFFQILGATPPARDWALALLQAWR